MLVHVRGRINTGLVCRSFGHGGSHLSQLPRRNNLVTFYRSKSDSQKWEKYAGPHPPIAKEIKAKPETLFPPQYSKGARDKERLENLYAEKAVFPDITLGQTRPYPNNDLSFTRPPSLSTPEQPEPDSYAGSIPLQVRAKYYFNLGKSYLTFYKTGLKNVWANYKEMRKIWPKVSKSEKKLDTRVWQPEFVVRYCGIPIDQLRKGRLVPSSKGAAADATIPSTTRREYQLYLRTRRDLVKLVPFGLVLMIFGEFTPLVIALLGSSIVPGTCRLPQQVQSDLARPWSKSVVTQGQAAMLKVEKLRQDGKSPWYKPWSHSYEIFWRLQMIKAHVMGLSPVGAQIPLLSHILYRTLVKRRMRRRYTEVINDMILIRREGGYARLPPVEVFECAVQYFNVGVMNLIKRTMVSTGEEIDPYSEDVKRQLVPILEAQADDFFKHDFTRLDPELFDICFDTE